MELSGLFQDFSRLLLQFVTMQAACQDEAIAVNQHRVGEMHKFIPREVLFLILLQGMLKS